MRIERLEDGYKITDLYIAGAILCDKEMVFTGVERKENGKGTMFIIKGDPNKIRSIVDNFFNGRHRVDAQLFKDKVKLLKARLYNDF